MRTTGSVNPLAFNTKLLCVRGQPEGEGVNHFRQRPLAAPFEGAFPNDAHPPADVEKEADSLSITPGIAVDLVTPEILPGLWPAKQWAIMPMPETTMHEDHGTMLWQNKVRSARKAPALQSVAKPFSVQPAPDHQLRLCILPPDGRHISAARVSRMNVSQPF